MLALSAVKGALVNVHVIPSLVKVRLASTLKVLAISAAESSKLLAAVRATSHIQCFTAGLRFNDAPNDRTILTYSNGTLVSVSQLFGRISTIYVVHKYYDQS